jgi:hypothetical protein
MKTPPNPYRTKESIRGRMQLNVHEVLREAQENIHKEPLRIIRQQRLVV